MFPGAPGYCAAARVAAAERAKVLIEEQQGAKLQLKLSKEAA